MMAATAVVPEPMVASRITPPRIGVGQNQVAQQIDGFLSGMYDRTLMLFLDGNNTTRQLFTIGHSRCYARNFLIGPALIVATIPAITAIRFFVNTIAL